jgi:hypothetical protein
LKLNTTQFEVNVPTRAKDTPNLMGRRDKDRKKGYSPF